MLVLSFYLFNAPTHRYSLVLHFFLPIVGRTFAFSSALGNSLASPLVPAPIPAGCFRPPDYVLSLTSFLAASVFLFHSEKRLLRTLNFNIVQLVPFVFQLREKMNNNICIELQLGQRRLYWYCSQLRMLSLISYIIIPFVFQLREK